MEAYDQTEFPTLILHISQIFSYNPTYSFIFGTWKNFRSSGGGLGALRGQNSWNSLQYQQGMRVSRQKEVSQPVQRGRSRNLVPKPIQGRSDRNFFKSQFPRGCEALYFPHISYFLHIFHLFFIFSTYFFILRGKLRGKGGPRVPRNYPRGFMLEIQYKRRDLIEMKSRKK